MFLLHKQWHSPICDFFCFLQNGSCIFSSFVFSHILNKFFFNIFTYSGLIFLLKTELHTHLLAVNTKPYLFLILPAFCVFASYLSQLNVLVNNLILHLHFYLSCWMFHADSSSVLFLLCCVLPCFICIFFITHDIITVCFLIMPFECWNDYLNDLHFLILKNIISSGFVNVF